MRSNRPAVVKVGDIFNRLTVLESLSIRRNHSRVFKCQCSCGNIIDMSSNSLRSGTKSCGCFRKETAINLGINNRKKAGHVTLIDYFSKYKRNARRRSYVWELTLKQFSGLIKKDCYWCGSPSRMRNRYLNTDCTITKDAKKINIDWVKQQSISANGIDRIENTIGYTRLNSVPCCEKCNKMKLNYTEKDFIRHINKISEFQRMNNAKK